MAIKHTAVASTAVKDASGHVEADDWNAAHTIEAGTITDTHVAAANKDGVAGTASMRTLGTGATQAAAGDHSHAAPGGATVAAYGAADLGPGIELMWSIPVADAAGNTDRIVTRAFRITRAWLVKTTADGGAGGSVVLKKGATTIGTMACTGVNKAVADIDGIVSTGGANTFAIGDTLRLTAAQGAGPTNVACEVNILAVPL